MLTRMQNKSNLKPRDTQMIKLNKKMFEPFEGPVTIKKGNGRRVSYLTVKRFADNLKEIAAKKRTSIAAILSEISQNKKS